MKILSQFIWHQKGQKSREGYTVELSNMKELMKKKTILGKQQQQQTNKAGQ